MKHSKLTTDASDALRRWASSDDLRGFNAYCAVLHDQYGYTYQGIANALGVTRERGRLRAIAGREFVAGYAFAPVTVPPPRVPPVRIRPRVDPVLLRRMRHLQRQAHHVRGRIPDTDPRRIAAAELAHIIDQVHREDGVSVYRIAAQLEVGTRAVWQRLETYGYRTPVPSRRSPVHVKETR